MDDSTRVPSHSSRSPRAPQIGFAANEGDAEAGGPASVLSRSDTAETEKTLGIPDGSPASDADGPFSRYCADNAPIWKLYTDQARLADGNLVAIFNGDLDPLLIFAGLFSAILAAFLIEVRKGLQEDLQNITNTLLIALIQNQYNATGPQVQPAARFEPTSSSRWVNGLWFSSLMFSLMSALGASLAKGWVTQFSSAVSGSHWADASLHCRRLRGLQRWHLKFIVQCLPILIHIAFFLFSVGLVVLVFQDDTVIGVVILALTAVISVLYIASSIHSAKFSDSPFRTPVSGVLRRLLTGSWRLDEFAAFPSGEDAQKAQALIWLLSESPHTVTLDAVTLAIAGLPTTPAVQDELFRSSIIGLLIGVIESPATQTLISGLYSLLHLVQTAPVNPGGSKTTNILQALVLPGGRLEVIDSLPLNARDIAICVKGRILLFSCQASPGTEMFQTEIPAMANRCTDAHLRRLFLEICLLALAPTKSIIRSSYHSAAPYDFLTILRDPTASNRDEVYEALIQEAISGLYLTASVTKSGTLALCKGLSTGPPELRRRYALSFAELVSDAAFRRQLTSAAPAKEICSFITCEDDDSRKTIANALVVLASDNHSRKIITNGFPAIIAGLRRRNLRMFEDILHFLADVASNDDIRTRITESDTMNLIMTMARKGSRMGKGVMDSLLKLTSYAEIRPGVSPDIVLSCMLALETTSWLHEEARKSIAGLVQYDDVRRTISTHQTVEQIVLLLTDQRLGTRKSALQAVASLEFNAGVRSELSTPSSIGKIMAKIHDPETDVRRAAFQAIVVLANHDNFRKSISTARTMQTIISDLGHVDLNMRRCALDTMISLSQHVDIRAAISSWQTMLTFNSILANDSIHARITAFDTLVALLQHNDLHAALVTSKMMHYVFASVRNPDPLVRRSGVETFVALARYEHGRTVISQNLDELILKLRNEAFAVRQSALEIVVSITQHEDMVASLSKPKMLQAIFSILTSTNRGVRQSGLETIEVLARHDDFRAAILHLHATKTITSLLRDPLPDACQFGLESLMYLSQHDDLRLAMSTPETTEVVISILENPLLHTRKLALWVILCLARYKDLRGMLPIPQIMDKIIALVEDPDFDMRRLALWSIVELVRRDDVRAQLPTPEILDTIFLLLTNVDFDVRRTTLWMVVVLMQCRGVRTTFTNGEHIQRIMAMLYDAHSDVRRSTVWSVVYFAQYDDVRPAVLTTPTIQKVISLILDPLSYARQLGLEFIAHLSQYDDVRAAISSTPDVIPKITTLLGDPQWYVRQLALRSIVALAEYDDVSEAILTPHTINQLIVMPPDIDCTLWSIVHLANHANVRAQFPTTTIEENIYWMLRNQDVGQQKSALWAVACLAQHDDFRDLHISIILIIISLLEARRDGVRSLAHWTLLRLVEYADFRAKLVSIPLTMERIVDMLGNFYSTVGEIVGKTIMALVQYDDLRKIITAPDIMQKMITMLVQGRIHVRTLVLQNIYELSHYADARVVISTAPVLQTVVTMFRDHSPFVRALVCDILVRLATYDDTRMAISTTTTLQNIIATLRDSSPYGHMCLVALIEHDDIRQSISTSNIMVNTLDLLNGEAGDTQVVRFTEEVLGLSLSKESGRPMAISMSIHLTQEILARILAATPALCDSYARLFKILPLAILPVLPDVDPVIQILNSIGGRSVGSAIQILICLVKNEQFRKQILKPTFWNLTVKFLRDPFMFSEALDLIKGLANYDDVLSAMIHPSSGVVLQLRIMTDADTHDIDRWQVGVKGLFALGLY